jgi:hypothetical protein
MRACAWSVGGQNVGDGESDRLASFPLADLTAQSGRRGCVRALLEPISKLLTAVDPI